MSVPGSTLNWSTTEFGWVFMGYAAVTENDIAALEAHLDSNAWDDDPEMFIDTGTLVGRWHRDWFAQFQAGMPPEERWGGFGSPAYELQKVNPAMDGAVGFKPVDQPDIWHFDPKGTHLFGPVDYPRFGRSFYKDEYQSTRAGPRPDSPAAKKLGSDGIYIFAPNKGFWVVWKTKEKENG